MTELFLSGVNAGITFLGGMSKEGGIWYYVLYTGKQWKVPWGDGGCWICVAVTRSVSKYLSGHVCVRCVIQTSYCPHFTSSFGNKPTFWRGILSEMLLTLHNRQAVSYDATRNNALRISNHSRLLEFLPLFGGQGFCVLSQEGNEGRTEMFMAHDPNILYDFGAQNGSVSSS